MSYRFTGQIQWYTRALSSCWHLRCGQRGFLPYFATCSCWASVLTPFPSSLPFLSPSSRCQSSNGASEPRIIGGGGWLNLATHLLMPVHNWDVFFWTGDVCQAWRMGSLSLSPSRLSLCFLCALFPALLRDLCHFLSAGEKKQNGKLMKMVPVTGRGLVNWLFPLLLQIDEVSYSCISASLWPWVWSKRPADHLGPV